MPEKDKDNSVSLTRTYYVTIDDDTTKCACPNCDSKAIAVIHLTRPSMPFPENGYDRLSCIVCDNHFKAFIDVNMKSFNNVIRVFSDLVERQGESDDVNLFEES